MKKPIAQCIEMINDLRGNMDRSIDLQIGIKPFIDRDNEMDVQTKILIYSDDPLSIIRQAGSAQVNKQANIWIRPDPTKSHPWLVLDDLPISIAFQISAKYASLIIETSPGNCQMRILSSRNLDIQERGQIQSTIVVALGGNADDKSTAGDKWGRLAGFTNRKPDPRKYKTWTNLISNTVSSSEKIDSSHVLENGFHLDWFAVSRPRGGVGLHVSHITSRAGTGGAEAPACINRAGHAELSSGDGEFRREFAFCCHAMRRGEPEDKIITSVAERAYSRGKRKTEAQAIQYARRTLEAAKRRLVYVHQ